MKRAFVVAAVVGILGVLAVSPAVAQSHMSGGDMCTHAPTITALQNCVEHMEQQGIIDNAGVATSLKAKLDAAQAAVDRGQAAVAVRNLNALIHQIEAQSGKHIAEPHASHLVQHVEMVISQLEP